MTLPVPPQVRLLLNLLGFTLLLVTVCGAPTKLLPSGNHPKQAEENVQKPEVKASNGSARLSISAVFRSTSWDGDKVNAIDSLPVEYRTLEDTDDMKWDDGTRNPRKNKEQDPVVPASNQKSGADTCDKWMSCSADFFLQYLKFVEQELPSCPCQYPDAAIHRVVSLFDKRLKRWFQWKDAGGALDLHAFQPSALHCLRSLLPEDRRSLSTQHCCYDGHLRLLTHGKGAGVPSIISPDYSSALHFMVDRDPWFTCKGDWSRLHRILPPNNGWLCPQRPSKNVYEAQLQEVHKKSLFFGSGIDGEKLDTNKGM